MNACLEFFSDDPYMLRIQANTFLFNEEETIVITLILVTLFPWFMNELRYSVCMLLGSFNMCAEVFTFFHFDVQTCAVEYELP